MDCPEGQEPRGSWAYGDQPLMHHLVVVARRTGGSIPFNLCRE